MLLAIFYHITRGEYANILNNVVLMLIMLFIYYGRTRLVPLQDRSAPQAT